MSEAARNLAPVLDRPRAEPLADLLPQLKPAEHNDNDAASELPRGEQRGFEIPGSFWTAMIAFYGVFFAAMFAAIGGGYGTFVLIVSVFFVVMFFGTTAALLKQGPAQPRSPLDGPARALSTLNGPLERHEVALQMLIVPACAAFLGMAVFLIRLCVS
jgi:hypothetical protein